MQIIKSNLAFERLIPRIKTNRIIIHHSASPDVSALEIHRWHLIRSFSGIGYHYVIRQNGNIEEGRPINTIGAHAGSQGNADSVGVCLTGNFEEYPPNPKQLDSLIYLINYLEDYYQTELEVIGHKDVAPTLCPGKQFPWQKLKQMLNNLYWQKLIIKKALKQGLINEYHRPEETAPKWFVLAVGINIIEKLGGLKNED